VAIIAAIAAVTDDNIGFIVGRYGGRPLLDRYRAPPTPHLSIGPPGGSPKPAK
jgi:hypothetical protein